MLNKILHAGISDYFITVLFFIPGAIFLVFVINSCYYRLPFCISNISQNPLTSLAFYLWFKAIIFDIVRIHQKQELTMPMFVYFVYGSYYFTIWIIYDLFRGSGITEVAWFWVGTEMLTALIFFVYTYFSKISSVKEKGAEYVLVTDVVRGSFLMVVAMAFGGLLKIFGLV